MEGAVDYQGEFVPPGVGINVAPIPMVGTGSLRTDGEGITANGFKAPRGRGLLGLLGFLLAAGAAGATAAALGASPSTIGSVAVGAGVAAVFGSYAAVGRKRTGAEPLELRIPWACIASVSVDPYNPVVALIRVKKHNPSGGLFFKPAGELKAFVEELDKARPRS